MGGDSTTTVDQGGDTTISAVHPDILRTHILTRLDGPTLASAGCASAQLHALSTEENLWREICNATWPSTADPSVRHLISAFPAGHRSFYSDSFPAIDHRHRLPPIHGLPTPPSNLISAVDIHYENMHLLSKVHQASSGPGSPFRIDLLAPKETVLMPVDLDIRDDLCGSELEENLTISWIVIDPDRTRALNVSSTRPVRVDRHWLTGNVELRYVTVLAGDKRSEWVQCVAVVTCGGGEGGGLHVREVSWHMEDLEGKSLCWADSMVILQDTMERGKRRKGQRGEERERYEEFWRLERERKLSRERRLELACIASSVAIFLPFWMFVVVKFLTLFGFC
ncbi:F-box protein At2g27310-like [Actinidia eriantha]|uniref:F-box protein At2g27310-like n=1 Tax=Actinidia eriantha TaxID=165200 RepID=UPI0025909F2B|nr:F-box protein At2g27310-like [Actinidia eriantha]